MNEAAPRSPSPVFVVPQATQPAEAPPQAQQPLLGPADADVEALRSVHKLRWALWWLAAVALCCLGLFVAAALATDRTARSMAAVPSAYELLACVLAVLAAVLPIALAKTPLRPVVCFAAFVLVMSLFSAVLRGSG